jgi:hypothetical protein
VSVSGAGAGAGRLTGGALSRPAAPASQASVIAPATAPTRVGQR